jgi:hypothetical protein
VEEVAVKESKNAIVVRMFEGEELSALTENHYLARDTEVAKWLKFERLEKIRDIIRRNREELNDYGVLTTAEETPAGFAERGGRPATVYYLNKEQALLVAMLSRAPGAAEVRRRLIRAFDAAQIVQTDSWLFNHYFLPKPQHTEYLWTPERLAPIARLYGVKYTGGRPPVETRNVQRLIYDLILGQKHVAALRQKYPDPPGTNGEPYIYDHFHPTVRAAFEQELDLAVLTLAERASGPKDFRDSLMHRYRGRPLQLVFSAEPKRLPPKKRGR